MPRTALEVRRGRVDQEDVLRSKNQTDFIKGEAKSVSGTQGATEGPPGQRNAVWDAWPHL